MFKRVLILFTATAVLSACASDPFEVVVSNCPAVTVLGDTGTLTRFDGTGELQEDLAFTASISEVMLTCESDEDGVVSDISFAVTGRRGPALTSDSVDVRYFVAVMRDSAFLVSKLTFDSRLTFGSNGVAVTREQIEQIIPDIERAQKYDYEILLGFQLTPTEVIYNRER